MEYKKVRTKKIYEVVTENIYQMIQSGKLKPGDKLDSVEQLATRLNVSRSAVREALSALKAMGFLDIKQGEGTYIKLFDPKRVSLPLSMAILMKEEDILHLLEVRKVIEAGTVAIAAKKRTEKNLMTMHAAIKKMENSNIEDAEKADFDFHLAIAEASQNPFILRLFSDVSELLQESMRETRKVWKHTKQKGTGDLYQDHLDIYKAIYVQSQVDAIKAMARHLDNVETVLARYLLETKKLKVVDDK